ncbi:Saccharopine dehydrogenase-domain-containing protein [Cantharellus anzutake]|uniref:Saccharopine dehydrogenase-domain-containing protein n=1 Tax=Cantharellus anzutake TaxID=1750568 RepID=UPI001902F36D|nr:Saccharopine dehydrogenase-domain-containing protein [Cantharellus anzutake]KAF8327879.1 Saccharopine dehydrogenase-domain-containing protein [Cantharellus anzutake]
MLIYCRSRIYYFELNTRHIAGCRLASTFSSAKPFAVGLRREDSARLWERRAPLTPDAVSTLVGRGVQVLVQSCNRRIFSDKDYASAGARIVSTLDPAHLILGIKEIPLTELEHLSSLHYPRPRTHLMFSHTHKGQPYNMPLLAHFLQSKDSPRLIDYENIIGDDGKRTVAFGFFAGAAGIIEGLGAAALDLLHIGFASPFLNIPRAYVHKDLASAKASLRAVGEQVSAHGTPEAAGPLVIAVTGNGNVIQGAMDMLKELPVEFVQPRQLPVLVADPATDLKKVYVVHAQPSSYLFRKDGGAYDRQDYYDRPSEYYSRFYETIAPYVSLLVNGAGWQPGFPPLMSNQQLGLALRNAKLVGRARFRSISDISCDVNGGIEFLTRVTTVDDPFYYVSPISSSSVETSAKPLRQSIQMVAVDILPTTLPLDASRHFSSRLEPYLWTLIKQMKGEALRGDDIAYSEALSKATIVQGGRLAKQHEWLYNRAREQRRATTPTEQAHLLSSDMSLGTTPKSSSFLRPKKRILLFGSGMVAKPFLQTIWDHIEHKDSALKVVVASNNIIEAEALVNGHEATTTVVEIDVNNEVNAGRLVESADIVASLLPASLHVRIAEYCLKYRKHLVTASYISPAMKDLNERAIGFDLLFLNEIGLDPGLDHLSAMELRNKLEAEGRKVISFISWCGGLPAPEDSNVPLGMKFSWSPRALLSAVLNDAHFKMSNKVHFVPGKELLSRYFPDVNIARGFALEGLANRDSLSYAEAYDLGSLDDLETVFRGTLRYKGFSRMLQSFKNIGLLSVSGESEIQIENWSDLVPAALGKTLGMPNPSVFSSLESLRSGLEDAISDAQSVESTLAAMSELSLLRNSAPPRELPVIPRGSYSPMELFATLLSHKLRYHPGERDMVILNHELVTIPSTARFDPTLAHGTSHSGPHQVHTSTLVAYGDTSPDGSSAMARTVGLPLAFAALRILNGDIRVRGVRAPVDEEIYKVLLEDLRGEGMIMKEGRVEGAGMGQELVDGLEWMKASQVAT